ncbi:MAG: hypothetical protein ACRDQ7_08360 [Haloechinothrix sp.]
MAIPPLTLRKIAHVHVELGPVHTLGPTGQGLRRIILITAARWTAT